MIKKLIKFIVSKIFKIYFIRSYSQEGEDMILRRLFEGENLGFYIDVGAHHPKRFSNTFMFYKKGWNGINIDAMPSSMKAFDKARPRDTNLEIPVSNKKELLTYYMFNEPALNGVSKNLTEERSGVNQYKVISEIKKYMNKNSVFKIMVYNRISWKVFWIFLTSVSPLNNGLRLFIPIYVRGYSKLLSLRLLHHSERL